MAFYISPVGQEYQKVEYSWLRPTRSIQARHWFGKAVDTEAAPLRPAIESFSRADVSRAGPNYGELKLDRTRRVFQGKPTSQDNWLANTFCYRLHMRRKMCCIDLPTAKKDRHECNGNQ